MSRPRLGYLTGEYPRATDTFIQREVAALRLAGFEVDTFAVRRPGPEHLVGPEQREGQATTTYLLELVRTAALPLAHLRALAGGPHRYLRGLRLAWETRRPGLRGGLYQLIYFAEAVLLGRELRKRRIDHLHNHFGDSSCTVAMLASEVSGVPYSFTLHGPGIFFEPYTWSLGEKVDRAAFTACISYFARSQAAIFASPDTMDRVHLIHCGIEPERLQPASHTGPGTNLVFVGRIVELKGLGVLFEALRRLVPDRPELTLTVVGDGPDRATLQERAESMGLGPQVDFVGSKSQAEVAELLSRADVFVLPSFAEGVPVVIMEALGAGLPVVASFVGGIAELVEDGINGFLVRPGDPGQLADRIASLVDDPGLRTRLGTAGRHTVALEFDSVVEASRLASLFVDSAAGRASPVRPLPMPEGAPQISG